MGMLYGQDSFKKDEKVYFDSNFLFQFASNELYFDSAVYNSM
jgi:hypothetical protein